MSLSESDRVTVEDVKVDGMKRVARMLPDDLAEVFCRHWMAAEVHDELGGRW